jgi:hypothetical protein
MVELEAEVDTYRSWLWKMGYLREEPQKVYMSLKATSLNTR